ncbi:Ribosomal protein L30/L7 family protein [Perilla frutescens var. hirtella]|uniref:Ribosomal protein L30/L7 family protein n=1 Tax=Perilla frutescens var. hirtella TaxID=608512 RepID=A0AAD4P814_PERFH|nr:Ribosomal protein L30/L7 family protein [Perilla frutescens var. hirtella]
MISFAKTLVVIYLSTEISISSPPLHHRPSPANLHRTPLMAEKGGEIVLDSMLKKQKRSEEWALAKKQEVASVKEKKAANKKLIYSRAKDYAKEYTAQVLLYSLMFFMD